MRLAPPLRYSILESHRLRSQAVPCKRLLIVGVLVCARSNSCLTIRSSGPLRRAAVTSCGTRQRPLNSSVSGAILVTQNRSSKTLVAFVALATSALALGTELSVEPTPLKTGSELIVHLSSTRYGNCWDGPLPHVSSHGAAGGVLRVFVTSTDYVECHATPLDARVSLGLIPAGVGTVLVYLCGDNPVPPYPGEPIPEYPGCSSAPSSPVTVLEPAIRAVPVLTGVWGILSLSVLLLLASCSPIRGMAVNAVRR